jgi:tetratricopeptide (TPR) repeat protein
MPTPIFINGRVMMEDGSPLPEIVTIERVCNGQTHAEGYTDLKGYFGIELGARNNGVMQDASNYGLDSAGNFGSPGMSGMSGGGSSSLSMGMDRFMNCELRAKLAGYRSQSVSLAMRRPLDDPNIGVILLHRTGATEAGSTVSAVSLKAPKDARKAYEKGMDALKKRKTDDALKNFEKAVEIYPQYATAWQELGILQAKAGKAEEAKKSFETASQADPKYIEPYLQLSLIAIQARNWQEAADLTDKVVKLDPFGFPQAFFFNSVANYNLKNVEAAEKSARQAEKLDTRHMWPKATHLLGVILAQRRDFSGAAERFRDYLKFAPAATDADTVRAQLTEVEKMSAESKQ